MLRLPCSFLAGIGEPPMLLTGQAWGRTWQPIRNIEHHIHGILRECHHFPQCPYLMGLLTPSRLGTTAVKAKASVIRYKRVFPHWAAICLGNTDTRLLPIF